MKNNPDFNEQYFDKEAYDFIRSISLPEEEDIPEKKPIKKRYVVIFLTLFAVLFVAVVRNTYSGDDTENTENPDISEYFQSDTKIQKIFTEDEIEERLSLLAQKDSRYAEVYKNKEFFPSDMLQAVCRNPEIIDFAAGYLTSDGTVSGEITADDLSGDDVPLFIQWDSRWGYKQYGDNVIGLSGCGPTCLSMVAVALTGDTKYSPNYVADFATKSGYYEDNSGTTWELFTDGCKKFGLHAEELPLNYNSMVNALEDGKPIICSMNPGEFTAVGHFIVIKDVKDGDFLINDPNSRSRSSRLWSYDELEWQIRNLWCFFNT